MSDFDDHFASSFFIMLNAVSVALIAIESSYRSFFDYKHCLVPFYGMSVVLA